MLNSIIKNGVDSGKGWHPLLLKKAAPKRPAITSVKTAPKGPSLLMLSSHESEPLTFVESIHRVMGIDSLSVECSDDRNRLRILYLTRSEIEVLSSMASTTHPGDQLCLLHQKEVFLTRPILLLVTYRPLCHSERNEESRLLR